MAKVDRSKPQALHHDGSECGFCLPALSRRHFLAMGAAGFLGLNLFPEVLYAESAEGATADHCILLWLSGGPSHIDTFDPKPGQATGGPFQAISTAADGIQLSQHLPKLAKQMKHAALIRSLTSGEGSHERATYVWHTGYKPIGSIEHPTIGATIASETVRKNKDLPAYVSVGPGTLGAGYLGSAYAPYRVGDAKQPTANLEYHKGVNPGRFRRRIKLLNQLDREFARHYKGEIIEDYAQYYRDAVKMMHARTVTAFDIEKEESKTRERYGMTPFGQGCLLAKRLVEVGVRFVEVSLGGWDTHDDNFNRVQRNLGILDPAVASLIEDLKKSGRLDRTMVVCMGEFGRTPVINARAGRDHYPRVWSGLIAGGGVKGGQVIGSSSKDGGSVKDRAVKVGDLHATIFRAIGVDLKTEFTSPGGRPFKIVQKGAPVKELF